jgi:hypothetical protein
MVSTTLHFDAKATNYPKVTVSIPAPYDYTHMHFPTHLFLYTFRTIPEGAMNASA